nr:unnamed protein product [Callosobruchus chinensis]
MDVKTFYGRKKNCASTSLNRLLDKISEKKFGSADIYIAPPSNDSEGDSEGSDADDSDEFANKFSSKILSAPAEASLKVHGNDIISSSDDESEDETCTFGAAGPSTSKILQTTSFLKEAEGRNSTLNTTKGTKRTLNYIENNISESKIEKVVKKSKKTELLKEKWNEGDLMSPAKENINSASVREITLSRLVDLFERFWTSEFFEYIKKQTINYSRQGKGTQLGNSDLGLGASVVTTFAERLKGAYPDFHFNFFIDNFFTGLPLLRKMTAIGFGCTGTIRENRIENCPLNKKDVKQKQRGFTNSFVNEDKSMIVIQWKDNSTVQVASNAYGVLPTKSAKRYSAAEKKNITVDMPNAINLYNENMGGTDLMDRNISNYRIKIRNNKWYWQTFTHLLSASASNAWILHKIEVEERKAFGSSLDSFEKVEPALDFLSFIRDIVSTYLLLNTKRDSVGRPKSRYVLTRKVGYLDVAVPPDFISEDTSGDIMVPEGGTVRLTCRARGHPEPHVQWRREDGNDITIKEPTGQKVAGK